MCSDFHCAEAESVGELERALRPIAMRCWLTSARTWSANDWLRVPQLEAGVQSPTTADAEGAPPSDRERVSRPTRASAPRAAARRGRRPTLKRLTCML